MPDPVDAFTKARELLGQAVEASAKRRNAIMQGNRTAKRMCSSSKLELSCRATLTSPGDIRWLEDLYYGGTISISTTRKRGPRVHIPRKLLKEHIRNNGFDREERDILWRKFEYSKTHFVQSQAQIQSMKRRKKRKSEGRAKT